MCFASFTGAVNLGCVSFHCCCLVYPLCFACFTDDVFFFYSGCASLVLFWLYKSALFFSSCAALSIRLFLLVSLVLFCQAGSVLLVSMALFCLSQCALLVLLVLFCLSNCDL